MGGGSCLLQFYKMFSGYLLNEGAEIFRRTVGKMFFVIYLSVADAENEYKVIRCLCECDYPVISKGTDAGGGGRDKFAVSKDSFRLFRAGQQPFEGKMAVDLVFPH